MENKILNALENLDKKFENLENRFDNFESQIKENRDILKILLHSPEIKKAEYDKMMTGITHIEGNVKEIKKDLSTIEIVTSNNYANLARLKAVK